MEPNIQKVVLIIADISGYTKFMVTNKLETVHSQVIISELMKTIISHVEIPLAVSKLEGDAVFLYSTKQDGDQWDSVRKEIGSKLLRFFDAFKDKIGEMQSSNLCVCKACSNMSSLKLKLVVHSGEAVFYRIGSFEELSGLDVIIAHRLLKNSLGSGEYILMTGQGYRDIEFPVQIEVREGREKYDEIGTLKTFAYFPSIEETPQARASLFKKLAEEVSKTFQTLSILSGIKKLPAFRNLPEKFS
jgi:hypothetical protein